MNSKRCHNLTAASSGVLNPTANKSDHERPFHSEGKGERCLRHLTNLTNMDSIAYMKTLQVAEAKTHFSTLLRDVGAGNEIAISYGKQKEKIAVVVPYNTWKKTKKRELGTLKGKGTVKFPGDWYMTDAELLIS
jgi:antitoxin (DNA-binding transcriptional repressor) of toxin-antitoxin stability system